MEHGHVKVVREVAVSRQKVYDMLVGFGGLNKMLPAMIAGETLEGSGAGAVRHLTLAEPAGAKITERCDVAFDGRFFAYSIVGDSPMPFENYVATVMLEDAGSGCRVTWESRWTPKAGQNAADVVPMLEGLYGTLIDATVAQLAKAA